MNKFAILFAAFPLILSAQHHSDARQSTQPPTTRAPSNQTENTIPKIEQGRPGTFTVTTKKGVTFKNCTLRKTETEGISVTHAGGISTILYMDITEEMRKLILDGGPFATKDDEITAVVRTEKGVYPKLNQYSDVQIMSATPDGVHIKHRGGLGYIGIEELPVIVKEDYGMTQENAENYRQEKKLEASQRQAAEAADASKVVIKGVVFQVLDDGILLDNATVHFLNETEEVTKSVSTPVGHGPTVLTPYRNQQYKTTSYQASVPKVRREGLVFVQCATYSLVDGQIFSASALPAGTYRYETLAGSTKTVKKYRIN